jgi:hypothetical protein
LLPLVERAQSSTFDCRDVNKDISAPALRLNKSIAFGLTLPVAILDLTIHNIKVGRGAPCRPRAGLQDIE